MKMITLIKQRLKKNGNSSLFLSSLVLCSFSPPLRLFHSPHKTHGQCWYSQRDSCLLLHVLWKPLCDKCALLQSFCPHSRVAQLPLGVNWNYLQIDFLSYSQIWVAERDKKFPRIVSSLPFTPSTSLICLIPSDSQLQHHMTSCAFYCIKENYLKKETYRFFLK